MKNHVEANEVWVERVKDMRHRGRTWNAIGRVLKKSARRCRYAVDEEFRRTLLAQNMASRAKKMEAAE